MFFSRSVPASPVRSIVLFAFLLVGFGAAAAPVEGQVPAPEDVFGFEPGADFRVADYEQLTTYYRRLSVASDRVKMRRIGTTVAGRPMWLLFLSSAANLDSLARWRDISATLARARVSPGRARRLADEGRAVVWLDAGLHSTELGPGQAMPRLAHRLATGTSAELRRIRANTVVLLMPMMNPDGHARVERWYDRVRGTPYETTHPPRLYHRYAGHDNNRDWFMNNLPETRAVTDVLYQEWYPQIVVNHHQTAPEGTRIFVPPFAGPVNPHIHPGVVEGTNRIGAAMGRRFAAKDMPGVVAQNTYTMFWNGGMRTTPYFHNQIGILTEVAHATPTPQYHPHDSMSTDGGRSGADDSRLFHTDPWQGGASRFRDAVRYTNTASMGVLRHAADHSAAVLFEMYDMGRDAIDAGRRGDPFAYVLPPAQRHPREAHNLVNILRQGGVEVKRASASFEAGGTTYPAGSFVVPAAQAFRPYLMDLLEPQQYPAHRGSDGTVEAPYDLAGWTLPLQMGVVAHRIDAPFEAHLEAVTDSVAPPPGTVDTPAEYGYVVSPRSNAAIEGVNELLAAGEAVHWAENDIPAGETRLGPGAIVVPRGSHTAERVRTLAETHGVDVHALDRKPNGPLHRLHRPRVALYQPWVPSKDAGWTRWLLRRYDVSVDLLRDADIRSGDLSRYTTVILPHHRSRDALLNGHEPGTMPVQYVGGLGREGMRALQQYVEEGGTVVAFDRAGAVAIEQFGLPVRDVTRGLSDRDLFVPGSLLRLVVNTEHPLGYGMPDTAAATFRWSRAFQAVWREHPGERRRTERATSDPPVEVVARYAETDLLMSGWARGEKYLAGKPALVRVRQGQGSVVLFGFRPQFRGQPRGTYKLLFNALHAAPIEDLPRVGTMPARSTAAF